MDSLKRCVLDSQSQLFGYPNEYEVAGRFIFWLYFSLALDELCFELIEFGSAV